MNFIDFPYRERQASKRERERERESERAGEQGLGREERGKKWILSIS